MAEPLGRRLQRAAISEVYEVRRILELEIARKAAQRRDEADLPGGVLVLSNGNSLVKQVIRQPFVDADIAFHLAISTASKNAVLTELYQTFATALREGLVKLDADAELQYADQAVLHEELLTGIAKGYADVAERCTAAFLDEILQQLC